jgi:hypothetical protein
MLDPASPSVPTWSAWPKVELTIGGEGAGVEELAGYWCCAGDGLGEACTLLLLLVLLVVATAKAAVRNRVEIRQLKQDSPAKGHRPAVSTCGAGKQSNEEHRGRHPAGSPHWQMSQPVSAGLSDRCCSKNHEERDYQGGLQGLQGENGEKCNCTTTKLCGRPTF